MSDALPGAVPEPVREERRRRLMELQAGISAERLARRVGQTLTVLVDQVDGKGAVARSAADAPEVENYVIDLELTAHEVTANGGLRRSTR